MRADFIEKIAAGQGFIAALDQSGGSTPKALAAYGVAADAWADDAEMFALIHAMRARIIGSPVFDGRRVLGAILFERTMDGLVDGQPTPAALAAKDIVPFIKIDQGLEPEASGVQVMKPIAGLDALLTRARGLGMFGTKQRSVIHRADPAGISAAVAQQMAVARQVLDHGLMPIAEPEVTITSPDRAACDALLLDELLSALDALPGGVRIMLKLSLPVQPGAFAPLVAHPAVLRVVALSGGFSRADACGQLARNPGIIASFSRALLSDLRRQQDDASFDATLDAAIAEIHAASIA